MSVSNPGLKLRSPHLFSKEVRPGQVQPEWLDQEMFDQSNPAFGQQTVKQLQQHCEAVTDRYSFQFKNNYFT